MRSNSSVSRAKSQNENSFTRLFQASRIASNISLQQRLVGIQHTVKKKGFFKCISAMFVLPLSCIHLTIHERVMEGSCVKKSPTFDLSSILSVTSVPNPPNEGAVPSAAGAAPVGCWPANTQRLLLSLSTSPLPLLQQVHKYICSLDMKTYGCSTPPPSPAAAAAAAIPLPNALFVSSGFTTGFSDSDTWQQIGLLTNQTTKSSSQRDSQRIYLATETHSRQVI